jgi:hypothetical protein
LTPTIRGPAGCSADCSAVKQVTFIVDGYEAGRVIILSIRCHIPGVAVSSCVSCPGCRTWCQVHSVKYIVQYIERRPTGRGGASRAPWRSPRRCTWASQSVSRFFSTLGSLGICVLVPCKTVRDPTRPEGTLLCIVVPTPCPPSSDALSCS